jgi:hypothetical protein
MGTQCCSPLICNEGAQQCLTYSSPILINLSNNTSNYHLTTATNGTVFDINADGVFDQVSWTEPDSNVAFLALDRNGNGVIDDGAELFGNVTRMNNGQRAANGFEALSDLDGGPAGDGQIDSNDAVYAQLRLWLDRNHNGVSESQELQTLQSAGVTTIFTEYRESRRTDRNGNQYKYVGIALVSRNGRETPRRIFDVYLTIAAR